MLFKVIKYIVCAAFILLLLVNKNVAGQNIDTIYLKKNQVLISLDTMYFGNIDSVIYYSDSSKYVITKSFAGGVEFLQSYYKSIILDTAKKEFKAREEFKKSASYYEPYKGKIIRNILFKQVEIFDGSVYDTTKTAQSRISKSLNKSHVSTRKWIIKQNVRFKKNTELIPSLISENERLIRNLAYIEDARIYIQPDTIYIDSVDILIVTKDKFAYGLTGSFSSFTKFSVEPYSKNFLGLGHAIQPSVIYNADGNPTLGFGGEYVIPNLSGLFIRSKFDFENTYRRERYRINFTKPFITNDIKYGGGAEYYRLSTYDGFKEYYYPDSVRDTIYQYSMDYYDVWLARSFFLEKNSFNKFLNVSVRYSHKNYLTHPTIKIDSNLQFHDQNLFLFRLSLLKNEFYKTSRLMGYGVTEDVPYGYSLSVLGGYQYNQYVTRFYAGGSAALTRYYEKLGYFALELHANSFFNENVPEDSKLGMRLIYYSPYKQYNFLGVRHFFSPSLETLINPRYVEYEDFGDQIRNLKQNSVFGLSTLTLRYESYFYTPISFIGFKFSFSAFADVGWITDEKYWGGNWENYAAIGIGVHLRNESLTIPTFSVQLGYYPKLGESTNQFKAFFDFKDRIIFENDKLSKPEVGFDF